MFPRLFRDVHSNRKKALHSLLPASNLSACLNLILVGEEEMNKYK